MPPRTCLADWTPFPERPRSAADGAGPVDAGYALRAHCLLAISAGDRRRLVGALVFVENIDTPLVPFSFRPRGGQERVDDGQRFGHRVHTATDADQLSIVVLAGQ